MAKVANFTPDEVTWTHVGISGTIKPGEKVEFEEGRANWICSKWGARGLVKLEFSEDPNYIPNLKAKAVEAYRNFWENHIHRFNQDNETMKNENKPYTQPDRLTLQKAGEFGINLIGPWKTQNSDNDVALKAALDQNKSLSEQLGKLTEIVTQLQRNSTQGTQPQTDWNDVRNSFFYLNKSELNKYYRRNSELMKTWPEAVKAEFDATYEKKFGIKPGSAVGSDKEEPGDEE
jgi:hypothetical protein